MLMNAWWEPLDFALPLIHPGEEWQVEIDTYDITLPDGFTTARRVVGNHITVGPRSVVVLLGSRLPGTAARAQRRSSTLPWRPQ